ETIPVVNEFSDDPHVRIFRYPVSSGTAVRGRNRAILEAKGQYIAFLDSDDLASPNRLAATYDGFVSSGSDVVYGAWRAHIDGTRQIEGLEHNQIVHSPPCDLRDLLTTCVPCQSTVSVR